MADASSRRSDVDAVLLATPEYNLSIRGGLKNAIDWASRPWGVNSFDGAAEPVRRAVLLQLAADEHNRGLYLVQARLITAEGEVTDEGTAEFPRNYMTELHGFIVRVLTVLPRNA